jgi:hypothetical protein
MKLDAGATLVVIAGGKGLGKSGVAGQVVADRVAQGWKVVVLRAGAFEEWMSPADVGDELGLGASPTTALAGVASRGRALLLIDQLDDVALGGSASNFFECVRVMVESAAIHDNLRWSSRVDPSTSTMILAFANWSVKTLATAST